MRLRTRIGTFVAAICVVGAIGAAPANAGNGPSFNLSSVSSLCKSIKDPKLSKACTDATSKLNTSKPADLKGLLDKYGKSFGGINAGTIQKLLGGLGGSGGTGGIDLSKILSGLGGAGGIDLSKLLGGFKF